MVIYNSLGCTNADACNYEPLAEVDNGACVLVGDSCDDGNPETLDDMINANCLCSGQKSMMSMRWIYQIQSGFGTQSCLQRLGLPILPSRWGPFVFWILKEGLDERRSTSETRVGFGCFSSCRGCIFLNRAPIKHRVISRFIVQRLEDFYDVMDFSRCTKKFRVACGVAFVLDARSRRRPPFHCKAKCSFHRR